MKTYAGIGARKTPLATQETMKWLAHVMETRGYVLRSGGAYGADAAFARGVSRSVNNRQIFDASHATAEAIEHAAHYHPAWERTSAYTQRLHARNSMIILGANLNDPVDFVICWTEGGLEIGGTGQSIRVAKAYGITVYNLWHPDTIGHILQRAT